MRVSARARGAIPIALEPTVRMARLALERAGNTNAVADAGSEVSRIKLADFAAAALAGRGTSVRCCFVRGGRNETISAQSHNHNEPVGELRADSIRTRSHSIRFRSGPVPSLAAATVIERGPGRARASPPAAECKLSSPSPGAPLWRRDCYRDDYYYYYRYYFGPRMRGAGLGGSRSKASRSAADKTKPPTGQSAAKNYFRLDERAGLCLAQRRPQPRPRAPLPAADGTKADGK